MLKTRTDEQLRDSVNLSSSLSRGLSPITPFRDAPDRFQWKWVNLENPSIANLTRSLSSSEDFSNIPHILQATKVGDIQTVHRILNQDGEYNSFRIQNHFDKLVPFLDSTYLYSIVIIFVITFSVVT